MNMPSFYQDELYRALVATGEVDLQVIYAKGLAADRVQLGWADDLGSYPSRTLSGRLSIGTAMRIAWSQRQRLHIVNGIWAEPAFAAALSVLASTGSTFAIYSEPPIPGRHRSWAKKLARRQFGRWVANRKGAGLMPISREAERYFSALGFPAERTYPFPYVRARPLHQEMPTAARRTGPIEILYVGQLTYRKGIDLLLDAVAPLMDDRSDVKLALVGAGPEEAALRSQVEALGIKERVTFEGTVSSIDVRHRIAQSDVLVLPSRWDGWGLVVNEALSVGVPALVSDSCGAAELVRERINGFTFSSEDVGDLRRKLGTILIDPRNPIMRAAARATGESVSIGTTAPYLIGCFRHMNGQTNTFPSPPWRKPDGREDPM